jgi:formylglycine-generating enzyme required for sulfatase activity
MTGFQKVFSVCALVAILACDENRASVSDTMSLQPEDTVFVSIPGGSFVNSRGETVEIQSFLLLKTEVSNRLYRYLADEMDLPHPSDPGFPGMTNYFYDFPEYPVVNISPLKAEAAAAFMGCRLPTRDEWEYAASRGLTGSISQQYPWGELSPADEPSLPANYMALDTWNERDADGFLYTGPCGSYPLSNAGLSDMAGNAAEMVISSADSCIQLMGGSWAQMEEAMTMGFNRQIGRGDITWYAGFRLAK